MKPASPAAKVLGQLALLFNVVLLISVTLNLEWARTRAAGGQFDEFPVAIRVIYFFMALAMVLLMRLLWTLQSRQISDRERRLSKWLGIIFSVSTILQLVSRSPDERWNAIPAIILAYSFFKLAKK